VSSLRLVVAQLWNTPHLLGLASMALGHAPLSLVMACFKPASASASRAQPCLAIVSVVLVRVLHSIEMFTSLVRVAAGTGNLLRVKLHLPAWRFCNGQCERHVCNHGHDDDREPYDETDGHANPKLHRQRDVLPALPAIRRLGHRGPCRQVR
jgi:hypothetical protein